MTASNSPSGCPICKLQSAVVTSHRMHDGCDVRCPACGDLEITREAWVNFRDDRYDSERWKVSAWVRQYGPEVLTKDLLEQALASAVPSVTVRARRLLGAVGRDFPPGREFRPDIKLRPRYLALSWSRDKAELNFLLQRLMVDELGWLTNLGSTLGVFDYALTAKGAIELESADPTESAIALCAMWYDASVQPLFDEVIVKSVRQCGYEPLRLDRKEHNNSIDDEIIASIRGARFVIADMTGHRGGVYYEAGFAHGLGLPVIFMLREDDQKEVHFDVRQQNFILWQPDDLPEARRRLENRIRATLGQGPLKPDRP